MAHKKSNHRMPKSVVVWEGTSLLDGKTPVVAIATGLRATSANEKTGGMIQVWILPKIPLFNADGTPTMVTEPARGGGTRTYHAHLTPQAAAHSGQDASVCGSCPHRGELALQPDGTTWNVNRSCYVDIGKAPGSVLRAWARGNVKTATRAQISEYFTGRKVRLGAYGDPAAIPHDMVAHIAQVSAGVTGYTHQWRDGFALQEFLMASCDTEQDIEDATALGWRYFMVDSAVVPRARRRGEQGCPASAELGARVQCEDCMACGGLSSNRKTVGARIRVHGAAAKVRAAKYRLPLLAA